MKKILLLISLNVCAYTHVCACICIHLYPEKVAVGLISNLIYRNYGSVSIASTCAYSVLRYQVSKDK